MEWRSDKYQRMWISGPYRIEKVRYKLYLYKSEMLPDGQWNMRIVGKFEELEDAKAAAEEDSKQRTLWGLT